MGSVRRNEMQAPSAHAFHPCLASIIHQSQCAISLDGSVQSRAITLKVEVAVSHEILRRDLARFHNSGTPELTAFRAFGERAPSLNTVHNGFWIHFTKGLPAGKNSV